MNRAEYMRELGSPERLAVIIREGAGNGFEADCSAGGIDITFTEE